MSDELQRGQIADVIPLPGMNLGLHSERQPPISAKFSGPISGAMWAKVSKLKSVYPDEFDYSMYDRLQQRFAGKSVRGGVVFRGGPKLLQAQDCSNCFHRFEIDTYGRGCTHNCAYCYAKSYLSIRKYWNEPMPFPIDISEIRKIFATIFESDRPHKLRSIMEQRIPLRIGSMSDSFMDIDKKYKVTQEFLKILRFYQYPYIIFTRSDLVADDTYMKLLEPTLTSVQMSISSINRELTRKIEPGAAEPLDRLAALKKLSENGFWTTVRINPLFPIYPDGYYTNPKFDHSREIKPFDFFSWDMIDAIADHKVPSILAGVARLYQPNVRFMNKALNYDIREHFDGGTKLERAALHFSEAEAAYYYSRIRDLCHKRGVRFSTCYIGNDPSGASFFKNQDLWSNKSDCCDAVGNVPAFKKTCADIPKPTEQPTLN